MRKEKLVQINTIEGYEDIKDYYWISNADEDKIINKDTGKIRKLRFDNKGYKRVNLMTKDGKIRTYNIHVMKAKAFIFGPNPLDANVVRHLNDVKIDNRLENLAFGTLSDNNLDCIRNGNFNYSVVAKKYSKPVRCIETGIIYPSTREAGRRLGIHNAGISLCCNGRCKTFGGYHWTYVDKEVNSNELECKQIR